jgi:hypothetical protein
MGSIYTGLMWDRFESYQGAWLTFAVLSGFAVVLAAMNRDLGIDGPQ